MMRPEKPACQRAACVNLRIPDRLVTFINRRNLRVERLTILGEAWAAMLPRVSDLLAVADSYQDALGISESTLASRLFRDSRKLKALRGGADITVGRYCEVMTWLSENWPSGAEWPRHVPRPKGRPMSPKGSSRVAVSE